jgi:hypothetical protein
MSSKTVGLDVNFTLSNFWFWGGREGQDFIYNTPGYFAQPDDGLKSRPKHVVVSQIVQYYSTINFVVFRLTDIAYCITLGHNGDVPPLSCIPG